MKPQTFSTGDVIVGDSGPTDDGSTKTQTMLRCPKKYQFKYERGIAIPRSANPVYFSIGSIYGAGVAAVFSIGFAVGAKAWLFVKQKIQEEAERSRLPIRPQDEAYGLALVEQYLEHWKVRPNPKMIATEYKVGPIPGFKRTGKLDGLGHYPTGDGATRHQFCIAEVKTTSGDIGSAVREYEFHPQTLQYQALYLMDPRGAAKYGPVDGHMFEICQKPEGKGKKPKFARAFVEVRPASLHTFVASTKAYIKMQDLIHWDSNPTRTYQCTYQAGRARVDCEYKPLCRYGKSGASNFVLADGTRLRDHKPVEGKEKMPWE